MKTKNITAALKTLYSIRKQYIHVLLAHALFQGIRPFIPILLSAKIIDELLGDRNVSTLIMLVSLLVGFMLITHIVSGFFTKKYNDETGMMIYCYYFELSKKSMKIDFELIEKKETIDLLHQIEGGQNSFMAIWNMAEYMQKGSLAILEIAIAISLVLSMIAGGGTKAVGAGTIPFIESPVSFALIAVVLIFGLFLCTLLQGKLGETAAKDMKGHITGNRIFSYLFFHMASNYENGKDIRVYEAQDLIHSKMKKFVDDSYCECNENFVKPNTKHYSLLSIVNVLMLVAIYIFIILKAYVGAITIGSIFIQINAITKLYESLGSFIKQYNMLKASSEHFQYSIDFFNLPDMKRRGRRSVEKAEQYIFELKNVSFKYPGTEDYVLRDANLSIFSGERLAIIGMNGAGKTTMVKLLCRLYEPTEGLITLNGVDIREYDFAEYIQLFSVVFQDFRLFAFPMDQNISTDEMVDEEKLLSSLNRSGLSKIVSELKGDLKSPIGKSFDEGGRDFSGGEKQKLAIARAIYRDTPIVILDEPTAALDPLSEYEIYSNFNSLIGEKTAIFISHRLSSCKFSRNIAVFDKGSIVQLGNHETLLEDTGGKYYKLWNAQAKHYIHG